MKYLVFIITVLTTLLFFIIYTSLAENLNLNDFGRLWIVILIILSLFLMFKKINKNNNSKKPVNNPSSSRKTTQNSQSRTMSEVLFIALSTLGLVYFAALITYSPTENPWSGDVELTEPVINLAGVFGAYLGDISLSILGYSAYLIPISLIWLGYNIHKNTGQTPANRSVSMIRLVAMIVMVAFSAAILAQNTTYPAGGWIGEMMHDYFGTLFGSASFIVYLSIMMISFSIASTASWANIFTSTGGVLGAINKNNNSKKPVKNTINESNESLDERKDSIKARRKAQEEEEEEEEEQKRAHLKGLLKANQERLEKEKAEKKKRDQILAAAAATALALRLKKPEVFAPQGYRITDMKLTNKFFIEWTIYYIDESKPNEKKYFKASIGSKGINTGGTLFKFKWASPI
jgi:hypothetical protein